MVELIFNFLSKEFCNPLAVLYCFPVTTHSGAIAKAIANPIHIVDFGLTLNRPLHILYFFVVICDANVRKKYELTKCFSKKYKKAWQNYFHKQFCHAKKIGW